MIGQTRPLLSPSEFVDYELQVTWVSEWDVLITERAEYDDGSGPVMAALAEATE